MAVKSATKRSASKSPAGKKAAGKKASTKKAATKKASAKKSAGTTKANAKTFRPGDKVAWGTSQGETQGHVVKKQTTPTKIKTHKVAASKDNPQYIVESDKSGKRAAHKPGELRKR